MKPLSLLLALGGVAIVGTVAVATPWHAETSPTTKVVRTGSADATGYPRSLEGRAGAPGRFGGWWSGSPAEPAGLRAGCIALLDGAASTVRPAECVGLFGAAFRPDRADDEVDATGDLGRACAALLRDPDARRRPADPEACAGYVASLDAGAVRRQATAPEDRAPDGPSLWGGIGGQGGRNGTGPGAGLGGAGGGGYGGYGGNGGPGGSVR
ncbi:hypothetical protein [Methylobacterium aquaticum]|jgi:hypothetical protein|uniref:Uncharacterized protein n=1 Tax=Methylobacterium aquaticum TaxID=270351 RepID=A0A0J6UGI8_9HYPH|nr:hypothetical protein [Methylobacterium aquaticum]KMO24921.1 hypothetical protein VP06_32940 [Methylobacterium aquaticum]